jgi:hypothetical protein
MLRDAAELEMRLATMVEDLAGMHAVSCLGFEEKNVALVRESYERIASREEWTFVDLRGASADEAERRLFEARSSSIVVAATEAKRPARALVTLVRAYIDRSPAVGQTSLFVICEGASEISAVDRELERVPYWSFVGEGAR